MNVREAITASGLLFQPHPDVGSWRTTRPGAFTGEVVAFKNDAANFERLSLRYFAAGETDENGQTYHQDTYIVETLDRENEYPFCEDRFAERENAVERIEEIMSEVTQSRE